MKYTKIQALRRINVSMYYLFLITCVLMMFLPSCVTDRKATEVETAKANGDYDQAVIYYEKALAKEPDNLTYRIELEKAKAVSAMKHLANGDKFLKENRLNDAEREYQFAFFRDPTLKKADYSIMQIRKLKDSEEYYKKGLELAELKKTSEARTAFKKAISLNPKNQAARDALDKQKGIKTKLDGFELSLKSTKPITLKFRDTGIKEVFEILSKLSGINFIFDEDVKDQKISIFLEDATFEQAMELLILTNKLFVKTVTDNTIIVIPRNPTKIKQYQDLVIHTFYLSHIEAKKAINLLKSMLQLKQIYVNEELNALIVRDEPERITLAQKLLEANDIPEAEVMMDVEIIEVSKDKLAELGLNLSASSMAAGYFSGDSTATDKTFSSSMTYGEMKNLSPDTNLLFSPIPQAVFNFKKTLGGAKTLANPKIRVINNGKAKIHIGDRIPVINSTAITGGATQTSVQYQDVGVKLNVEPNIHIEQDVTIKLSLEVSTIGTPLTDPHSKLVVAYQIGTRTAETTLSLRDGETQVIGGLIRDDERNTKVSIPFLGEIPVLGRLFSTSSDQKTKTDILLAITPHVLRGLEIPSEDVTTIWSGKEDDFSNRAPFESFQERTEPEVPSAAPLIKEKEGAPIISSAAIEHPVETKKETGAQPGAPISSTVIESDASNSSKTAAIYMVAPDDAKVNVEFPVEVALTGATNLYGASINITFDPELLYFVKVVEEGVLKQDGKATSFMHAVNDEEGIITVGITRLGGAGGVSGSGSLFSALFKGSREGRASIGFQNTTLKDSSLATLPSTAKGVEVNITK